MSTQLFLFISFILVIYTCSYIIYLSMPIPCLCASLSLMLWCLSLAMDMCYSSNCRYVVGSLCVCVVSLWTEPLNQSRGIVPHSIVRSWVCPAVAMMSSITHPLVFLVDFVVPSSLVPSMALGRGHYGLDIGAPPTHT